MIAEIEHLQRPELVEQDSSCVIAPWEENPYQLVSWWQMKPFPISRLLRVVRGFASMPPLPEGGEAHPLYSPEQDKAQREMIENFRNMRSEERRVGKEWRTRRG